jgi:hypothetical protein
VVWDEVEDQLQPARVRLGDDAIEIADRAEQRVDRAVVGNVVAEVGHGRAEDRRDPHRVDPEPGEVVEPAGDAVEVADAVAVGVLERARIDLVDDAALPPGRLGHGRPREGRSQTSCEFARVPRVPPMVSCSRLGARRVS